MGSSVRTIGRIAKAGYSDLTFKLLKSKIELVFSISWTRWSIRNAELIAGGSTLLCGDGLVVSVSNLVPLVTVEAQCIYGNPVTVQ
jgi:hypothetical protein